MNLLADLREGRAEKFGNDGSGAGSGDETIEFLRRLEIVDAGPETPPRAVFADEPEPVSVTLFLTTACNLRCAYRYAAAGEGQTWHMPLELARRGEDHFELNFHGGEPVCNRPTLTATLAHTRRQAEVYDLRLTAYIATNAVFSEKQLDWIVAHLD